MNATSAVLLAGLVGAALLIAIGALLRRGDRLADPADPVATEHWLVQRYAARRRLTSVRRRRPAGSGWCRSRDRLRRGSGCCPDRRLGVRFDRHTAPGGVARWDQSVADWGPDHAGTGAVGLLKAVTNLGSTWLLVVVMTLVGIVDWRRRGDATSVWFLLTVGLGVILINNSLKLLIMRDRPPVEHLVGAAGSSFPSGHLSAAAACWMAMSLVVGRWPARTWRPWVSAAAVAIASAVAASRALLGVHWVSDVVAGLAVGWGWFLVVVLVFGGRFQRFGEPIDRVVVAEHVESGERSRA